MTTAQWCDCTEKLIPVGALAVWMDGVEHRPEACTSDQESAGRAG